MQKDAKICRFLEPLALGVAGGASIRSAAESCKCGISNAYRISSSSEFRVRVGELRSELTSRAVGALSAGACQAVQTIVELLADTNEPSVRLNAAKAILNALGPLSELGELRARLDALESGR